MDPDLQRLLNSIGTVPHYNTWWVEERLVLADMLYDMGLELTSNSLRHLDRYNYLLPVMGTPFGGNHNLQVDTRPIHVDNYQGAYKVNLYVGSDLDPIYLHTLAEYRSRSIPCWVNVVSVDQNKTLVVGCYPLPPKGSYIDVSAYYMYGTPESFTAYIRYDRDSLEHNAWIPARNILKELLPEPRYKKVKKDNLSI